MKKYKITELCETDELIAQNFNVAKIKQMSYDQFKAMAVGWSIPVQISKDKFTIPKILKPIEAELKTAYKKLTGGEVPVSVETDKSSK